MNGAAWRPPAGDRPPRGETNFARSQLKQRSFSLRSLFVATGFFGLGALGVASAVRVIPHRGSLVRFSPEALLLLILLAMAIVGVIALGRFCKRSAVASW